MRSALNACTFFGLLDYFNGHRPLDKRDEMELYFGVRLLERRNVWWPTLVGWSTHCGIRQPGSLVLFIGESFLSQTE